MALYSRFVLVLLYGWSYLCVGYCAMLKTDNFPERQKVDFTQSVDKKHLTKDDQDLLLQDTMTEHMQMLYAKYNRAGFPFKDGNTVRSFKAHWGRYLIFLRMLTTRGFASLVNGMCACFAVCILVNLKLQPPALLNWNYPHIASAPSCVATESLRNLGILKKNIQTVQ